MLSLCRHFCAPYQSTNLLWKYFITKCWFLAWNTRVQGITPYMPTVKAKQITKYRIKNRMPRDYSRSEDVSLTTSGEVFSMFISTYIKNADLITGQYSEASIQIKNRSSGGMRQLSTIVQSVHVTKTVCMIPASFLCTFNCECWSSLRSNIV